jgi:hypothetical protein
MLCFKICPLSLVHVPWSHFIHVSHLMVKTVSPHNVGKDKILEANLLVDVSGSLCSLNDALENRNLLCFAMKSHWCFGLGRLTCCKTQSILLNSLKTLSKCQEHH